MELREDLPAALRGNAPAASLGRTTVSGMSDLSIKEAEKELIVRALKESNGSRTEAAKKLGMSRRTLHRKLHTYRLEGFE